MNALTEETEPIGDQTHSFEVFYDAHCPLCYHEIEMIRRMDKHNTIKLTDISATNFDPASTGKTLDELMREIHGRTADGQMVVGVEVFREIYGRLGFGFLVKPSRWSIFRWPMDLGYRIFAGFRYRAALKRYNKTSCQLPASAFPTSNSSPSQQSP